MFDLRSYYVAVQSELCVRTWLSQSESRTGTIRVIMLPVKAGKDNTSCMSYHVQICHLRAKTLSVSVLPSFTLRTLQHFLLIKKVIPSHVGVNPAAGLLLCWWLNSSCVESLLTGQLPHPRRCGEGGERCRSHHSTARQQSLSETPWGHFVVKHKNLFKGEPHPPMRVRNKVPA